MGYVLADRIMLWRLWSLRGGHAVRILAGVEVKVHGIRGKLGMWQYERGIMPRQSRLVKRIMLSGSGWAVEWIIICEFGWERG